MLTVVLVYLLLHGPGDGGAAQYRDVLAMVALGFAVGVGIVAGIVLRPGVSHIRRGLGMLADYGLMAAAMIRLGEPLAVDDRDDVVRRRIDDPLHKGGKTDQRVGFFRTVVVAVIDAFDSVDHVAEYALCDVVLHAGAREQ